MLRIFLRSIAINLASVYIAAQILSGVIIFYGGFSTLFFAALFISMANLLVKPLINLLLLPIHLVTLGLFRWVANLVTLYLTTLVFPSMRIHSFVSPRFDLTYLIIPSIHFSAFGAFIVSTLTLTFVFHCLYWLMQD
jgi:putative membrane protein